MASMLFEYPQQPTHEYEGTTGYPTESELAWIQSPIIQDVLQWCLKRPRDEWKDPKYIEEVAEFLTDRSHSLLKAAEELKLQDSTGGQALEQATERFFAARMLAGLGDIITETRDITWLKPLVEQEKGSNVVAHEAEVKEVEAPLRPVGTEPTKGEISLTEQIIQTIVLNEKHEASGIKARVEAASAFRNGWVMGIVEELMDSAKTMRYETAVDKLTNLFVEISSELKLNKDRLSNDNGLFAPNEAKMLEQANTILQVADRVFRDISSLINRKKGDIKGSVLAVMDVEVEELRRQACKILEVPAQATKHEMDWARQTLEVLKASMSEETSPKADNIETGDEEIQPLATVEDSVIQPGVPPESARDIAPLRPAPAENPSFVRSITYGGEQAQPAAVANAMGAIEREDLETKIGNSEVPGVILAPEMRANLINIAMALGDEEAEKIAKQDYHSAKELKVLQAMTRRAHELKKREEPSRQSAGRPDTIMQAKRLGGYVSPSRRGYA